MEKIISYKAIDGKVFENEEVCARYEEHLRLEKEIDNHIQAIIDYCNNFGDCCDCRFFNMGDSTCQFKKAIPCEWKK